MWTFLGTSGTSISWHHSVEYSHQNWTHKKFDFFVSGFQKGPPFDKRGPFYEISCIFSLDFKQTFESWTIVSGLPFENWTLPLFG